MGKRKTIKIDNIVAAKRVETHGAFSTDCVGVAGESLSTLAFHEANSLTLLHYVGFAP